MSKKIVKLLLMAAVLVLGVGGLSAQDPVKTKEKETKKAPSLAQLARQTRAKNAARETPVRTITNADLPGLNARLSQGFAEPGKEAEGAEGAEKVEGEAGEAGEAEEELIPEDDPFALNDAFAPDLEGEVLDESELSSDQLAVWQDAFGEARMNLQNAVNEALVLQLRMNNLENSYFAQSDGSVQERLEADLSTTMQAISANKQLLQEAQTSIEALKANALAAGIAPEKVDELVGKLPNKPPEIEIREPEPPDPDEPPDSPPAGEPAPGR